jgi:branched-chain amino acid transport system ATP-binding protein
MLTVKDLHSYYDKAHILQGVSLNVEEGQIVCLIGKNGMGKSTTVKSIMGIAPPQVKSGQITFDGRDITRWPSNKVSRLGISYVPEERRIFPLLTVRENLALGLDVAGSARDEKKNALEAIFIHFPMLHERLNQLGEGLSGGEQQMLAIARAMIMNPRLILMDEPTEGLMPLLVQEIKKIILTLKQNRISVLLLEQSAAMALDVSDIVYVMEKGSILFHGTPQAFREDAELMKELLGV